MDMKRPLMPGFLQKAEKKLLINRPAIWSTRLHLVLYYGFLFMIVLAIISFLDPLDIRRRSMAEVWVGYVSVISAIALVAWLIFLLRFNVFKKYGIIHPLYSLVTYILIFIATAVIVLFTYVQMGVESVRANAAFNAEEIVQDMNNMNLKLCQLENAVLHEPWSKDTVLVLADSVYRVRQHVNSFVIEQSDTSVTDAIVRSSVQLINESDFEDRRADSVIKLNDSLYVVYETPLFNFVSDYGADRYTRAKELTAFQVYHQAVKPTPPENKEAIAKEFIELRNKYLIPEDTLYGDIYFNSTDTEFEVIRKKYRIHDVNRSIGNVVEKMQRWEPDHLPVFTRVLYYVTLSISLLIFIFRNSTVKTFFLSLLTAVLLTILTSLFLAYSSFVEASIYLALIIYTILFFIGSLANWVAKKRSVVTGIATNLFVLLAPILPLMCANFYYQLKLQASYRDPDIPTYEVSDNYWLIAEWAGAILFLVLLATYIHRVYRRWYSLPED